MKKLLSVILAAALTCPAAIVSAEDGHVPIYKTISVTRIIEPVTGSDHVNIRICDEEFYDEAAQGYKRVACEDGKRAFVDGSGRVQIPIREIAETLHFSVDWNETEQRVTLTKEDSQIIMHIGDPEMTVNGEKITMDTAPIIVNDLTYIPLRYVGEAFGYTVDYSVPTYITSAG